MFTNKPNIIKDTPIINKKLRYTKISTPYPDTEWVCPEYSEQTQIALV